MARRPLLRICDDEKGMMKKLVYILISILILTYIALALLAEGEYEAEKLLYRASKAINKIAANPDVVPPAMHATAEDNLQAILDRYPKTNTAKHAQDALVQFYMLTKEYDEAIGFLDGILEIPDQDRAVLSKAHFLKGNAYEMKGEPDKALAEYVKVRDEYQDTPVGIQVPLYIGDYYTRMGRGPMADEAYKQAVTLYTRIAKEDERKPVKYMASTLLAQTYINLKRYKEAGDVIEDIINTYPAPLTYRQHLPIVDFIFVKMLNRPEKAIEIYSGIKEKSTDANLNKMLKTRIGQLKEEIAQSKQPPAPEEAPPVPDKP